MKKREIVTTPMPQALSGPGEVVTAKVAWVNPNHYVEVREQVGRLREENKRLREALEEACTLVSRHGSWIDAKRLRKVLELPGGAEGDKSNG